MFSAVIRRCPTAAASFLFFSITSLGASTSVKCTGASSDASLIQTAVNSGGTVSISGTCSLYNGSININNAVNISGPATLMANPGATDFTVFINSDNVSIDGLTFVAAGVRITGANRGVRTNVNLTNNIFRDFTMNPIGHSMAAAVWIDPIWRNSKFTGNTVRNLWYGGFSNTNSSNVCSLGGSTLCDNTNESLYFFGLFYFGGLDNTQIEYNTFSEITGNGVKGFNIGLSAIPGGYQASGVSISYNTFTYIHRIGIEVQDCTNPGSTCNGFANVYLKPKFAGNFLHSPAWGFIDTYAYSLPVIGTGIQIINNAAIGDFTGNATRTLQRLGYGIEEPPGTGCCGTSIWDGSGIEQGNLIASDINPSDSSNAGWYAGFVNYGAAAPQKHQYNLMCGPNGNETITNAPSLNEVDQNNYKSASCPSGSGSSLYASNISGQLATPTMALTQGTFPLAVVSALPIRYVQFSLDGTALSTQEIADANTNFQNDRKWIYHATVSTGSLASGTHNMTALVTDVSGVTQTYSENFTVGTSGPTPAPTVSPNGTTIPNATQIVDANHVIWTLSNGASYENGAADGGTGMTMLLYFNGSLYANTASSGWFTHTAGSWQSVPGDPRTPAAPTPSANGTTIPSATQIIDSKGVVWTIVNGNSYENGVGDEGSDITLLLYFNGVIYANTSQYGWWWHASGNWTAIAGDPRIPISTSLPRGAYQFVDPSGNAMDLGWALNPSWGDGLSVRTYAAGKSNVDQVLTFTASGQLQSAAQTTDYLYNAKGTLTVGGTAGVFNITKSGNGYTIKETASGLYVTTAPATNSVTLSATPTVWTALTQ